MEHPESETLSNIWGIPNLIDFSERQSPPPTTEAKNVSCAPSASLAARTQPKLCQSAQSPKTWKDKHGSKEARVTDHSERGKERRKKEKMRKEKRKEEGMKKEITQ